MSKLDQVTNLCYTVYNDRQTVIACLEKPSLVRFNIKTQWQEQLFEKELALEISIKDIERLTSQLDNVPKSKVTELAKPQKGSFCRLDWHRGEEQYSLLLLAREPLLESSIVDLSNDVKNIFHIQFVQSYGVVEGGKSCEQSKNFEAAFKAFLIAIELLEESYITPDLVDDSDMKFMAIEENYNAGNHKDSCEATRRLLEGKLSLYCDKYYIRITAM